MTNNEFIFDIQLAAILSLGSSKVCQKTIKTIYVQNEIYFYEYYKNSKYKDNQLKEIYSAIDLEHINMLIGIFDEAYKTENFVNVNEVIKSLNPRIFKFIKNKNIVAIDEFIEKEFFKSKYRKKVGTGIFFDESFSEQELYANAAVLVYIADRNEQRIAGLYKEQLNQYFTRLEKALFIKQASLKPNAKMINEIDKLKSKLGLTDDFINRQPDLGTFLDNLIEYEIESNACKAIGLEKLKKEGMSPDFYKTTRKNVFKHGLFKYIGVYNIFAPLFDIETDLSLSKTPINSLIINQILFSCVNAMKGNDVPETEVDILFISELFLYSLSYHYNELKDTYLHSEKEKYFDDITSLRDSLNSKYNTIIEEEKELTEKVKSCEKALLNRNIEISQIKSELSSLNKINKKQENQLEKYKNSLEEKQQELDLLYDLLKTKESVSNDVAYDDKVKYIKSKKIAMFGGNKTTLKQLASLLGNISFYEKNTSDLSALSQCDAIFINYEWLKHSVSFKMWSYAKKANIPFYYTIGTNISKLIDQIYDSLITQI